ncbi:MAG TPA: histidine kinase [Actinospica sp.]|nr:histidine kinase [Actinospica sp.]HWG27012.1 histidine kinase [Actinospica sp.]
MLLTLCVLLLALVPESGKRLELSQISPLFVLTSLAESVPLTWRRKAPVPVYYAVLLACWVQWAAAENSASSIGLMVALYTVTRYRSQRTLRVAVGAIVPGLIISVVRVGLVQHQVLASLLYFASAIAASIAIGMVAEERHAQMTALTERAAHAEFEREQRARMAVLAERARFSREMHDIVGHTLAVITGLSDGGVRQVEANPERGRQALELIGETSRHALADLRRTLGALRERPLDDGIEGIGSESLAPQPGVDDIAELLERTRAAGPRVSYGAKGRFDGLPRSVQLAIYRIVQESLTNSLKHAGPDTSVQVAIDADAEALLVSVSDTGPEHQTTPAAASPPGQGLTGVRERAALAGGRAEAGPNRLGGWTVTAQFPLQASEEP